MKKILALLAVVIAVCVGAFFYLTGESNETLNVEKITINHVMGSTEVPKNPTKVIVFDYGIVDMLDTVGIEIIGLPKDSLPKFLDKFKDEKYINIGGLKDPNLEKIYELKPDLIIVSGRQEPFYEQLSKIAPTVGLTTTGDDYLEALKVNVKMMGDIFSKNTELNKELATIETNLKEIKDKVESKDLNALVVLSNNGKLSAYGLKSRFAIVHDHMGFKTVGDIGASTHGSKINFEYILEKNPNYIFVVDRSAVNGGDVSANKAFDNDIIKVTDAYKNGNIIFLDAEIWYTATGGIKTTQKMIDEVKAGLK
ncbi:ABC transporter substrate-binding protein [uncultured Cetobacterium sp.]|uniref:siderophore ABC transporter substrate-binding protein n=1 Tax=uncultured Cetobacterium sp. TaxID=527638 RepID=UPI0025D1F483|nr:ABC transporter substrate-binding protein [uncultured Cetobacterium sp.]